jgi:hypothetical protein
MLFGSYAMATGEEDPPPPPYTMNTRQPLETDPPPHILYPIPRSLSPVPEDPPPLPPRRGPLPGLGIPISGETLLGPCDSTGTALSAFC